MSASSDALAHALFNKLNRRSEGPVKALVVGLGNPGSRYARTRHNVGADICERLIAEAQLGKPKQKYAGRLAIGRIGESRTSVAILLPGTFMNESGKSVSPARGSFRLNPDQVIVVHDEIDLPFGRIETRLGGGLAGHNGLKSVRQALGTTDFYRVRVGVGRPESTDPERVSAWVLSRFAEDSSAVADLIESAAQATLELVDNLASLGVSR